MNVLILTPDAVGSTLLQRLITIYMQFHDFDQPVINLHELTNGIMRCWNDTFNREILYKPEKWGYYQTLDEIKDLLASVDHYKTSRLAQYHITRRQDPLEQQIPFYQYLDENFFIISCRRRNVFEHALSWGMSKITKKLNVYSPQEKIDAFYDIYRSGITLDPESLIQSLEAYKNYLEWADNNFSIASYFYYDEHLGDIESYILTLPVFSSQPKKISWKDNYDISLNDWNRCHRLSGDIGNLALENSQILQALAISQSPTHNHPTHSMTAIKKEYLPYLNDTNNEFLSAHADRFNDCAASINKMKDLGILVGGVPMKKQTLIEKSQLIVNWTQCVDTYNKWAEANPSVASPMVESQLLEHAAREKALWDVRPSDQPTHPLSLG
jgi:hypothetical protein